MGVRGGGRNVKKKGSERMKKRTLRYRKKRIEIKTDIYMYINRSLVSFMSDNREKILKAKKKMRITHLLFLFSVIYKEFGGKDIIMSCL